ncbi:MAG: hypothetical protein HQ541_04720 [Mariniphaga sp.]|nr:hypothetical protein [Mariniphaga sp.]
MKRKILILSVIAAMFFNYSCEKKEYTSPGFEDMIQMSIYSYIVDSTENNYSSFLKILESGGIDKTLSAYNLLVTIG